MFVNRSYRSCVTGRKLEFVSYVRHALVNRPPASYISDLSVCIRFEFDVGGYDGDRQLALISAEQDVKAFSRPRQSKISNDKVSVELQTSVYMI